MENQTPIMPTVNSPQTAEAQQSITDSRPKANSFLIILLSILLLISCVIAGFFAYGDWRLNNQLTRTSTVSKELTSDQSKNWKTYTNEKYKYSVRYPENWFLRDISDGSQLEIYYQPDKTKPVGEILFGSVDERLYIDASKVANEEIVIGKSIAKCLTDDTTKIWCYLNNDNEYLSILIIKEKDEEYNKTLDQILSTFKFTNNAKEEACIKEKYTWLSKYNECESPILVETFCKKEGGVFSQCESPCRHDGSNGFCTEECIAVCKFE